MKEIPLKKNRKYHWVALVILLCACSVSTKANATIYKIMMPLQVDKFYAFHKNHHFGFTFGIPIVVGKAEVRMYFASEYHGGGRTDNSLLWGGFVDNEHFDMSHPNRFYAAGFNWSSVWFCGQNSTAYFCPRQSAKSNTAGYYNTTIVHAIKQYQYGLANSWWNKTIPVVIELDLSDGALLEDIFEIRLPGVDILTPDDFVTFEGDFSSLFGNEQVTVVAHRGYWETRGVVQNSKAAIQAASDVPGLNWIELDIRSTKDKHPILFHDDMPQKILQGVMDETKSVYDYEWDFLKGYKLYDRFNLESAETLLDLAGAFQYIIDHGISTPVNMDIGIPEKVPQQGGVESKVDGKPYLDAVFLQAIDLACKRKLTDQVIFKGKYTFDDLIWLRVDSVLRLEANRNNNGDQPKIAYTPKLGDDTKNPETYFDNWLKVKDGIRLIPCIEVVGIEIRLKSEPHEDGEEDVMNFLNDAITVAHAHDMKVGIFSEAPSTCQGYWTKSARENYIKFSQDWRNDFEWLLSKKYDYIITDFPTNLIELREKKFHP